MVSSVEERRGSRVEVTILFLAGQGPGLTENYLIPLICKRFCQRKLACSTLVRGVGVELEQDQILQHLEERLGVADDRERNSFTVEGAYNSQVFFGPAQAEEVVQLDGAA